MSALTLLVLLFDKVQFLALAFLAIEFWLLLKKKSSQLLPASRLFFWSYTSVILVKIIFLYTLQFLSFNRYLLPPHRPVSYFFSYSWQQFGKEPVFAFGVGLFFFCLLWFLTKVSRGRFFYEEEKYAGGLAVIANLWPQNSLVIFLTLALGIVIWLAEVAWLKLAHSVQTPAYLSLRVFWPVAGILLLVFGQLLVASTFLENLRI